MAHCADRRHRIAEAIHCDRQSSVGRLVAGLQFDRVDRPTRHHGAVARRSTPHHADAGHGRRHRAVVGRWSSAADLGDGRRDRFCAQSLRRRRQDCYLAWHPGGRDCRPGRTVPAGLVAGDAQSWQRGVGRTA